MRAYNNRRIPIPPQRRLAPAFQRLQYQFLSGRLVMPNQHPVLRLGINGVRINRVHLGPEPIAPGGHKPVRVHDAIHISRPRRPTPGKIILRSAADVVERRRIIHRYVVNLHRRQIRFELPSLGVVVGLIHAAIRSK